MSNTVSTFRVFPMLSNLSFAGDFTITSLSFPNCFRVLILISKWRMFKHFCGREVGTITIMVINPTSVNQSDCTDHKRFQSYIAEIKVLIFYPLSLRLVKEYQLHLITTPFTLKLKSNLPHCSSFLSPCFPRTHLAHVLSCILSQDCEKCIIAVA